MKKATIVSCLILVSLSGCMSYVLQAESDPAYFGENLADFTKHSGKDKVCKKSIPVVLRRIGCFMDKLCYVKCPGNFKRCKQELPRLARRSGCITITDCKVACFQYKGTTTTCNTKALKALNIKECKLDNECALECCETHKCPKSLPKAFKKYSCSYTEDCDILCKMGHGKDFAFQQDYEKPYYSSVTEGIDDYPVPTEDYASIYGYNNYNI